MTSASISKFMNESDQFFGDIVFIRRWSAPFQTGQGYFTMLTSHVGWGSTKIGLVACAKDSGGGGLGAYKRV